MAEEGGVPADGDGQGEGRVGNKIQVKRSAPVHLPGTTRNHFLQLQTPCKSPLPLVARLVLKISLCFTTPVPLPRSHLAYFLHFMKNIKEN